jgi:hypothetical protein
MDEAKAIINIKEGIIELSGPVDFVRQYLDRYQSAIKIETAPEKAPAAPAAPTAKVVKEPALPVTKAIKGPAAPAPVAPAANAKKEPTLPPAPIATKTKPETCIGAIRSSIQSGFFDEPRSFSDVRHHLDENKIDYNEKAVRAGLTRLAKLGTLRMVGRGRGKRYSRPE